MIDETRILDHADYRLGGGADRIHHEGEHRGFRWAIVDMLGTTLLIIKPVRASADSSGHGIPREEIPYYLNPSGLPTKLLFSDAQDWLIDMGQEPSQQALNAIADIVTSAWPLWWKLDGSREQGRPIEAIKGQIQDQSGNVISERIL